MVAIVCEDSFYVLRFHGDAFNKLVESGATIPDDGVEEAFEFITEVSEK